MTKSKVTDEQKKRDPKRVQLYKIISIWYKKIIRATQVRAA